MEHTFPTPSTLRRPAPVEIDMATLYGEWAEQARRTHGFDSERLALAIRVVEALQHDLRAAARPAQ